MSNALAAANNRYSSTGSEPAPAVTRARVDIWILSSSVLLLAISCLMVFSTTAVISEAQSGSASAMIKRHLMSIIIGVVMATVAAVFHPKLWFRVAFPAIVSAFALLLGILLFGHRAGGAQRWFHLGPVTVQPAEFVKICSVFYIAAYAERNAVLMRRFFPGIVLPALVIGLLCGLLLLQPDFGSAAVIFIVFISQISISSRPLHLIGLAVVGAVLGGLAAILEPYRVKRLLSFLDPLQDSSASGYQLVQSLIAVGSGGIFGVGLGAGQQKLFYLPAAHTDFIYAVIAEELGLIGAVATLCLYLVIFFRGLRISRRLAGAVFLSSLALGCTLLTVLPALLNFGVVLGILPTKGLVLPLVAYGGTAMISHLIAVGILLRLSRLPLEL